jgi:N-acetylmuramoyl-L-alanine amidase
MLSTRRALIRAGAGAALACGGGLDVSPVLARRRYRAPVHSARASHPARPTPLPLVVIDPGHGGKDPGCIGVGGVMEKQVVLRVGLELRRQLLASRRCRVAMTRASDVFIPLEERVRIAQRDRAAVMISLHANAAPDRHVQGAVVYRFAFHASDPRAAAEARLENDADRFGLERSGHSATIVLHILASLMRRETVMRSAALQRDLVTSIHKLTPLCADAARHARFVVLSAPDVPSALVELGFLTNGHDAAMLRRPAYQAMLARGLQNGVHSFLAGLPAPARHVG